MRLRSFARIPRPAPATALAIAALVLAAGGFAVAAIPEPDGTIHGCYAKNGGNLRVVKGKNCAKGEKALSWNQGVSKVTARKGTLTIHFSCISSFGGYSCGGTGTGTVRCLSGERATGGGYSLPPTDVSEGDTIRGSRPSPSTGRPTGWAVTGSASAFQPSSPTRPDTHLPIYAVCAA